MDRMLEAREIESPRQNSPSNTRVELVNNLVYQ